MKVSFKILCCFRIRTLIRVMSAILNEMIICYPGSQEEFACTPKAPIKQDLGTSKFPRSTTVRFWFNFCNYKFQKCDQESIKLKEERVAAFRWTINNFLAWATEQARKMEPLTSPTYIDKERRWRGALTSENNLFLQLLAATHPVNAEIR